MASNWGLRGISRNYFVDTLNEIDEVVQDDIATTDSSKGRNPFDQGENDGVTTLRDMAERGNGHASMSLANLYFFGRPDIGLERNTQTAARYYEQAADQGIREAQYNTAVMYLNAISPYANDSERYNKAIQYFHLCIQQNYSSCFNGLAHMYFNGVGVEQNITLGMSLFHRGAQLGSNECISNLASIYYGGVPGYVEKNYTLALEYLNLAVYHRQHMSIVMLAGIYKDGLPNHTLPDYDQSL